MKVKHNRLAQKLCFIAIFANILGTLYIGFVWVTKTLDTSWKPGVARNPRQGREGSKGKLFTKPNQIIGDKIITSNSSAHRQISAPVEIEVWGKAAIGLYLWEHVLEGPLEERLGGVWSYGELSLRNMKLRFRTGPGVVQTKVPQDVRHLVLTLNGRELSKVEFAKAWLDYLPHLTSLQSVTVVILGNEKCRNSWLQQYLRKEGGLVDIVFLVYDSPEVDNVLYYQWPLGVATYRKFPLVRPQDVNVERKRSIRCSFLGTIYPNSSREELMTVLKRPDLPTSCYTRPRYEWLAGESPESQADYITALQDSDLTLHPVGMNTECYRAYEALSYGSVPVIEDVMTHGDCDSRRSSDSPFRLLKEYNAPVIYVKKWTELVDILKRELQRSHEEVIHRRRKALEWYNDFKKAMKKRFLDTLEKNFQTDANIK